MAPRLRKCNPKTIEEAMKLLTDWKNQDRIFSSTRQAQNCVYDTEIEAIYIILHLYYIYIYLYISLLDDLTLTR